MLASLPPSHHVAAAAPCKSLCSLYPARQWPRSCTPVPSTAAQGSFSPPPRLPPTATHWQHQPWEGPPVLKCDEQSRIQDILLRFPRVVSCKGKERKDIQIKACAHTGRVNIYAHARAHTYICTVYAHTLYMNSICPHTVYIHHMHTHTTYIHSHYTYICIHKYICTYCICMQHTSLCTHTYIYSICIHAHTFTHCTCTLYIYPHTVYAHYTLTCTHTI